MWLKRVVAITILVAGVGNIGIIVAGAGFGVGKPADNSNIQTALSQGKTAVGTTNLTGQNQLQSQTGNNTVSTSTGSASSNNSNTATTPTAIHPNTSTTTPAPTSSSANSQTTGSNTSATGSTVSSSVTPSPTSNPSSSTTPSPSPTSPSVTAPSLSFSASPASIVTGNSSNLSWSTTGTNPACSASGGWSGNKSASGSQSVSPTSTTGYTLSCSNSAGTVSKTVTITVTQPVTYCGGSTPCYGPSDMANHAGSSSCWGYNGNVVYDLGAFAAVHPGGSNRIGGPECGGDISGYLNGSASYNGSHDHTAATKNNTNSLLLQYKVGYFDASKP